jgi:hypothetical protein
MADLHPPLGHFKAQPRMLDIDVDLCTLLLNIDSMTLMQVHLPFCGLYLNGFLPGGARDGRQTELPREPQYPLSQEIQKRSLDEYSAPAERAALYTVCAFCSW